MSAPLLAGPSRWCVGLRPGEARPSGTTEPSATPIVSEAALPTDVPSPTMPQRTPSAECHRPPVDLVDLVYQTDPSACYGNADLTIEGRVTGAGAIDCGPILPARFACERIVEVHPLGSAARHGVALTARSSGPSLFAVLHPSLGLYAADPPSGPLRLTGHYDDPAAVTCRYVGTEAQHEDPDTVVLNCRSTFVIIALKRIGP